MHPLALAIPFLAQADAAPPEGGGTLLKFITGGGPIGFVIVALSVAAVALLVIVSLQLRRTNLLPVPRIEALRGMLGDGQAASALEYCQLPANDCYLTRILAPALRRYQRSAFGAFEMKNALEEAGAEETARLYRTLDAIGVIGAVAPLLGLLGTVQGMIGAFDTVAASGANNPSYYGDLASNISIALVTTFQGLTVAIPCVTLYTFFRNRIDALAAEAALVCEDLMVALEGGGAGGRR